MIYYYNNQGFKNRIGPRGVRSVLNRSNKWLGLRTACPVLLTTQPITSCYGTELELQTGNYKNKDCITELTFSFNIVAN